MKKRIFSKKIILVITSIILLILLSTLGYFAYRYYSYESSRQAQITKINLQMKELPELEEDIFSKCMEQSTGGIENIPKCQENTQKQMHTLAQDLQNAKKNLNNKEWYEFISK